MNRAVAPCWEREHSARRLFGRAEGNLVIVMRVEIPFGSRQNAANSGQHARAPQNLRQKLSGMRVLGLGNLFGHSGGGDFTTRITGFWAEIDDPIGALNHLQIVFDHYERMPAIHKTLE